MSWREIFQEPELVKNANASDLDTSGEDALVISGLRIDNPAAAWVSKATLKTLELKGEPINKYASEQVNKACGLFNITDDMFALKDVEGYSFIVKEAGMNAEFCILSQDSFEQAVNALFEKRASAPYTFCRDCAIELNNIKNNTGYSLDFEDNIRLQKMAGNLDFNTDATVEAIKQRAEYIRDYKGNYPQYQSMMKLANICSDIERENSALMTTELIRCIDEVDREYDFMNKLASKRFTPIEEVAYLTREESLIKEASEEVDLDGVNKMTRRAFMIPEVCDEMAKWASDNGYATTADPDDIIDCISSMSESLREEFVQLFG
jgi:hypothetical protein